MFNSLPDNHNNVHQLFVFRFLSVVNIVLDH